MNVSRIQLVLVLFGALLIGGLAAWFARPLLFDSTSGDHAHAAKDDSASEDAVYTCPMHPAIVSDSPGTCPICHMDLVKKTSGGSSMSDAELEDIAHVAISPVQRVLANVHTTPARAVGAGAEDDDADNAVQNTIRAVGVMAADQEGLSQVPSWVDGRIEQLRVKKVGTVITRGQAVMDIYSPDLYAAQQEFLLALDGASDADRDDPYSLLNLTRERLVLQGMDKRQIRALENTRKAAKNVTVRAPNAGTVTEILVRQGQYVNTGTPLFAVEDLSTLRVEAEVRARDLPNVRVGANAHVVSDRGDSSRHGHVEFIEPTMNPQTRTVKVRITLDSDTQWLPKDAFVTAYIERSPDGDIDGTVDSDNNASQDEAAHDHAKHAAAQQDTQISIPVLVPRNAVIRSGASNRVYIEREDNVFEPREVSIGAVDSNTITVTKGLEPGEVVVTSGVFLLDSEAQLTSMAHAHDAHDHTAPIAREDIPDKGKKFTPSIPLEQAPDDVWLCNMGDFVHWIQRDEKDGICPLCKMDLVHHTTGEHSDHDNSAHDTGAHDEHEHATAIAREDIPDEGEAFSPSIPLSQAPNDVWLCNMGDFVHWIQRDKKDATCPLCKMDLIHHTADEHSHHGTDAHDKNEHGAEEHP